MVAIGVLGPLTAEVAGRPVDLGGPRQRAVLGLLLSARGEVVSVDRLVEDLWRGEPPPKAIGALQAYVSNLRRAIEPDRPPRSPARVLISSAPGYAVQLDTGQVDAWRFESLIKQAAQHDDPKTARASLEEALALWRGRPYAEFDGHDWTVSEAERLNELRLAARERLADCLIRTGAASEAVVEASTLVREAPLREEGWRLLALGQYAAGRQADATATLRQARRMLAEELGLDPGPALISLERDVLAQTVPIPGSGTAPTRRRATAEVRARTVPDGFIGRLAELGNLRAAADSTSAVGIALVAGDPGAGKSALLERFAADLVDEGWRVALGRCPESDGSAPGWAWVEVLRALAAETDPGPFTEHLAPLLTDLGEAGRSDALQGRFRLHRAVAEWLATLEDRPLAVVLDDIHRADRETLSLLATVAAQPSNGQVLLIAAYRPSEITEALTDTLAELARHSPNRLTLSGLNGADAAKLITRIYGSAPDPAVVEALTDRTDGNPFYLQESSRLLLSEGALVATSQVPEGVADVLRRRFARLPAEAVSILRLAAVIGRNVDVPVLLGAAEADEDTVLDALEAGVLAGLLTEPAPQQVRFAHVLIRETLYSGVPAVRRVRWHARVAHAVAELNPDDLDALAHHHAQAATAATAGRAIDYSVRAADRAERRFAYDTEANLFQQALRCHELLPVTPESEAQRVRLLIGLMRAQVRASATVAALGVRAEALEIAERLGRDDLAITTIVEWNLPTPWISRSYATTDAHLIALLERLLADTDLEPEIRCRLLCALVGEVSGEPGGRAETAADEALVLAREIAEPYLIGLALMAQGEVTLPDLHLKRREAIGRELTAIGIDHDLVVFEVLGHVCQLQTAAVRLDFETVRDHLERARALATAYGMTQSQSVTRMVDGMLAHAAGKLDLAEEIYAEAGTVIQRHGSVDAAGIWGLAIITLRTTQERHHELLPLLQALWKQYGSIIADDLALALAQNGRLEEARAARANPPPIRVNFFWVLFTAMRAIAVVATGETEEGRLLYSELLPFADQLAGAGTGSFTVGPVAQVLGDLAVLLDDPDAAAEQYRRAAEIAIKCGSMPWSQRAARSLASLAG
jgi:DNA-binding SARP family transcriptional activator